MKFKYIITLLIVFITLNIGNNAYSQNKDRGLWVWSATDSIIDDFIANDYVDDTWESFISFCSAPYGNPSDKIINIYMSAYAYMRFNEIKMSLFLSDMTSRGYKVFVILADPIFAVPNYNDPVRGNIRTDFEAMIDDIIQYQLKVEPNQRFAGIMLDIEPHLLDPAIMPDPPMNWNKKRNFIVIWETYLNDLSYCKTRIDDYNASNSPAMSFSDAVASWYDQPADRDKDGTDEILTDDIMPLVSFYTVQAYSDTQAVVLAISEGEIAKAEQQGKECVVGVETMPNDCEGVTFYNEGHNELETVLDSIYDSTDNQSVFYDNDAFGGFAIHSYANNSGSELGYQNLTPIVNNHAPIITIIYPNGVEVDGITFSDDFSVNWEVQSTDSKSYDVQLSYKFASDLDNDAMPWTVFDTDTNVSASVTASSSTFDITGLSTSSTDRIIIRARISYTTGDALTTEDRTNFGIGIKEIPDMNVWSDPINVDQDDYAQGLKVIIDNEGIIHALYYYFYYSAVTPGIYYSRSADNGLTWSTTLLTPDPDYSADSKSKWPRKHCFSKNGKFLAAAWIEHYDESKSDEFNMRVAKNDQNNKSVYIMFSDDNGLTWQGTAGSTYRTLVHNQTGYGQCNFPNLVVDDNGDVHLTFSEIRQTPSWGTIISYIPFTYSASNWTAGSIVEVKSAGFSPVLSTPSVCKTSNGKLVFVWGEVYVTSGITDSMKIVSKAYDGTWYSEKTSFFSHLCL
ncbi:exo-alpha-sialidase [bacterium]|nr:exo-alpha-sialidase [bacterium]